MWHITDTTTWLDTKALLFFCLQANVKIESVSIFFDDGGMPLQLVAGIFFSTEYLILECLSIAFNWMHVMTSNWCPWKTMIHIQTAPSASRLVRCPFSAELVMATAQQFVQAGSQTQSSQEPDDALAPTHGGAHEADIIAIDRTAHQEHGTDGEEFVENSQEDQEVQEEYDSSPRKRFCQWEDR